MPRCQITLQGGDANRFSDTVECVGELRGGAEPSNAEIVRMMMDQFDPSEAISNPDGSMDFLQH